MRPGRRIRLPHAGSPLQQPQRVLPSRGGGARANGRTVDVLVRRGRRGRAQVDIERALAEVARAVPDGTQVVPDQDKVERKERREEEVKELKGG